MSGELLYILVEGEPASPELPFLQNSISKIFKDKISDIGFETLISFSKGF